MFKLIYQDIVNELNKLELAIKLVNAFFKIVLAMFIADINSFKYHRDEKKKVQLMNKKRKNRNIPLQTKYDMNFNVMIMNFKNKRGVIMDRFMVANNNEVIILARKLKWLPKRTTSLKLQNRHSVFYTTSPKSSKIEAITKYQNYVKAVFYAYLSDKKIVNVPENAVTV